MYLKCPSILYHPSWPEGRLFDGSEDKPVPHPGEDWVTSPAFLPAAAPLIDAEAVIASNARSVEVTAQNDALQAEIATAKARLADAETDAAHHKAELMSEREAHGETRLKLEKAENAAVVANERTKALEPEAAKVPGLTEQLTAARSECATLKSKLDAVSDKKPAKVGGL